MTKCVKTKLIKTAALGVLAFGITGSSLVGGVNLVSPAIVAEAATPVPTGAVEVRTIKEFEAALKNVNVTAISVKGSLTFTKNIGDIPLRNVTVFGNKDAGYVINSKNYAINGKQTTSKKADAGENCLFSMVDAKITANQVAGRFFTGGSGNGPSSFGWDVYANGVEYDGDRFVHLSEGKLTFDGTNTISTRAENAWVHELEFKPNSVYNGKAAQKDHGQFSAFYFNGRLINGKATGVVTIGEEANVNIEISPQSNVNYYYPAFYDKVHQVNVGENAQLSIDAAGVGFQFIPRADYLSIPSLNLAESSKMTVNGRGGGNYATMKIQEYGTQINMHKDSELVIDGKSKVGVIESIYEFASFNIDEAKNLEITNHLKGQPIFYADRHFIRGTKLNKIETWGQQGGDYANPSERTFDTGGQLSTYVGLRGDAKDASNNFEDYSANKHHRSAQVFSPNDETAKQLQIGNYGKVRFLK